MRLRSKAFHLHGSVHNLFLSGNKYIFRCSAASYILLHLPDQCPYMLLPRGLSLLIWALLLIHSLGNTKLKQGWKYPSVLLSLLIWQTIHIWSQYVALSHDTMSQQKYQHAPMKPSFKYKQLSAGYFRIYYNAYLSIQRVARISHSLLLIISLLVHYWQDSMSL